jgi:hypothetical protein
MSEPATPALSLPRRALAVVVGLFAAWQFVYLPAANLIDLVPRRTGPPLTPVDDPYQTHGTFTSVEPRQRAADWTGDALDFWTEVTGQEQGWSLFAPGPPPYTLTPAVEFRFANGPSDTLLSPYEPTDKVNPRFRPPMIHNRPFNFESQFDHQVWYVPPEEILKGSLPPEALPEALAQMPAQYRDVPDTARALRGIIRAFLAWRLKEYRAAHPERGAPVEVVLKHRFIPTPKPGEPRGWTKPAVERPFALWRPADDTIEVYDILEGRFVPVGANP